MILLPSDPIEVVIARTSGPPRPCAWIPMQGKLVNKST